MLRDKNSEAYRLYSNSVVGPSYASIWHHGFGPRNGKHSLTCCDRWSVGQTNAKLPTAYPLSLSPPPPLLVADGGALMCSLMCCRHILLDVAA